MSAKMTMGALLLCAGLVVGACTSDGSVRSTNDAPTGGSGALPEAIPQPTLLADLPVAPESERVDLAMPTFTQPTEVTNPLFPISNQGSVLLLGRVDGKPFRTEVTLLPDTRIIEWAGQPVETLVSQYAAFLDGRIEEVAYDFYAQADDGSVWYFGEDVFNFKDGAIADTHGTWIAGKDGPAAMIMPANPRIGDVYRPENIPGFVFEEVTVTSVGETLDGPLGPVDGGLVIEELHMDGSTEDKSFAPGYGEFYTAGGGDVEALAMAVPTDAVGGPVPAELEALRTGASGVFDQVAGGDWDAASASAEEMAAAWESYRAGGVPRMIEPRMSRSLANLARVIDARDAAEARQAAIDVTRWSLDLEVRYRSVPEIDLARFDLWAAQLQVDAAADDLNAVNGDFFALDYVRDRILHALQGTDVTRLNAAIEEVAIAVSDEELAAATDAARALRELLVELGA